MAADITYEEVLRDTYRARWRLGWAAVAPALEPYLDAARWPSGAPLPLYMSKDAQKRPRTCPPLPSYRTMQFWFLWAAYSGLLVSASAIAWVPRLARERAWTDQRVTVAVLWRMSLFFVPFVAVIGCAAPCHCANYELKAHVRALHHLLQLHQAAARGA